MINGVKTGILAEFMDFSCSNQLCCYRSDTISLALLYILVKYITKSAQSNTQTQEIRETVVEDIRTNQFCFLVLK